MNRRFTIDGSNALEQHIEHLCAKVLAGVRSLISEQQLDAIFLGGGYGRGEGGVLKTENGDQPYNDLEFYVCTRGNDLLNEIKYKRALHHLAEQLTTQAGIEIELKLTSLQKIKAGAPSMFFYDLAMGHRTIFGDANLFSEKKFRDEKEIPLSEATRLLMNRCTGLLLSQERLQREALNPEDADFIGRNQAKAQLGFGDVILAALGQYHWSARQRNERLKKLSGEYESSPAHETADSSFLQNSWPPPSPAGKGTAVLDIPKVQTLLDSRPDGVQFSLSRILCHHSLGVEFKLHPQRKAGTREIFLPLQTELCSLGLQIWLWLESRRLQQTFTSARDYAFSEVNKCPETNPARNRLINVKMFGPLIFRESNAAIYPRHRVLNVLPLLLWENKTIIEPQLLHRVQTELRTEARTFPALVDAYVNLWRNFS